MILPFSQQLNGQPTYFPEKIVKCIHTDLGYEIIPPWTDAMHKIYPFNEDVFKTCKPKRHSMREDLKDRWRPGMQVHPALNNRTKKMLVFERDVMFCVSTQKIEIKYNIPDVDGCRVTIWDVSGGGSKIINWLYDEQLLELANNDGFETVEAFLQYFNKDFTGKIIHWTDLRY